ncbi:MAG: cystathionine gamma-synthase [Bacteroidetes bacterium RIFCSPLOWO2_02_FULL_36_8]|nr:MAG: cystathionine gamma-synthase [Bacteroidetes bacterium RIFCSPLOWO2_02_FULL_36_8]OFY69808.1 MAG: cystathionine gamma-synthase [Bacteroidetes bacterium RIFCSPLOWO2_12_FULL_37_12]
MHFNTKAIHAGQEPDPTTGAVMTPIYQTSTYAQSSPGNHKGYEYSRTHNPTRTALQNNIAALEGGKVGLCFSSGLAATDCVIKILQPGDEVICSNDLYGGTFRIFTKIFAPLGIKFHFLPMGDLAEVKKHINVHTKLIWLETPTNPLLNIIDIKRVCDFAHKNKLLVAVDNTFATPYLQQPLALGADIVVHSATKYLGGHSDVVLGAIVVNDLSLAEKMAFIQNSCGATPGPMDCFLVLRGIKTLHIRMERHCENGKKIAFYLKNHPKIEKVWWPGFPEHPNHKVARTQMKSFGGMVSFMLKGDDIKKTIRVMERFKIFTLAESLGGVESLVCHPATMTHASIPKGEREKNGLRDTLIRLSVGIEDAQDLVEDLGQAVG